MAFNSSNLYNIYSGPPGFGYYVYKSDIDTRTTVLADGYFNNDDDQVNFNTDDLISVTGIEGGYKLRVTSVTDGTVATEAEIIGDSIFSLDGSGNMVFNEDGDDIDLRIEGITATHLFTIDAGNNRVGVSLSGNLVTDGLFHIASGTAGTITANTDADELVLEGAGETGLSIISADNFDGNIYFGTPAGGNTAGQISFSNQFDLFTFKTQASEKFRINAAGIICNEGGDSALDFRAESDLNTHMFFLDSGNNSVHIDNNLLTGAGDGDLVMANDKGLNFIVAAGTTSSNYGVESTGADALQYQVPANSNLHSFLWAGANKLFFQEDNSGAGIVFVTESSADHAAPATNRAVLYTKDVGGKTAVFFRFATGAVQQIAVEP